MARNLRSKLPADDILFVQDVNKAATSQFLEENPTGVRVAGSAREVAEKAVSTSSYASAMFSMMNLLSYL